MFMIHSPQTVTLHTTDSKDDEPAQVSFGVDGADTSRCIMTVTSRGRTWKATFNTRGHLVDQAYTAPPKDGEPVVAPLTPADYMVDGRDIRSDNPYTHVAPMTANTAYPPGPSVPTPYIRDPGDPVAPPAAFFAPPLSAEEQKKADEETKKIAEQHYADAAAAARKAQDERARLAAEKPEERVVREKKEREERLKAANATVTGEKVHPEPDATRPDGQSAPHVPDTDTTPDWVNQYPFEQQQPQNAVNTTHTLNNPPTGRAPVGVRPAEPFAPQKPGDI